MTACATRCCVIVLWNGDSKIVEAFAEHDFCFAEAPWNDSHNGAGRKVLYTLQ